MTTDEQLEQWHELGSAYIAKFRENGGTDHEELLEIVDELLSWTDPDETTNKGIVMAWEGVGRRVLALIDDELDEDLVQHITTLKILLGEPGVEMPVLRISIELENVEISAGLNPLDADSYLISISDAHGLCLVTEETPHDVQIPTEE
jgi:hypothetical protein